MLTIGQLSTRIGWPAELVFRSCLALESAFIDMSYVMAGGVVASQMVADVCPAAGRAVGQWPSVEQYFDRLVEALEGRATALPEGAERTRLQQAVVAMGHKPRYGGRAGYGCARGRSLLTPARLNFRFGE